ncbi:hypothetical protein L484_002888 [Morus notabilis]|uniref:Uncharacterized protein n=1 Tax=Morus notabilis TaxID=981085 RepID=W9RX70_9ROSA|nr:hypothetical protein L484_002888 [Morus notabilis]
MDLKQIEIEILHSPDQLLKVCVLSKAKWREARCGATEARWRRSHGGEMEAEPRKRDAEEGFGRLEAREAARKD